MKTFAFLAFGFAGWGLAGLGLDPNPSAPSATSMTPAYPHLPIAIAAQPFPVPITGAGGDWQRAEREASAYLDQLPQGGDTGTHIVVDASRRLVDRYAFINRCSRGLEPACRP